MTDTLARAQFDQFAPGLVLGEGVKRAVRHMTVLERAVVRLVAAEAARFHGVPVCEVSPEAPIPARVESRRARATAIYVLHTSLGYPKQRAAALFQMKSASAGLKQVRKVEDARDACAKLDAFLDRLDVFLRAEEAA
jgi:hypothetical protein